MPPHSTFISLPIMREVGDPQRETIARDLRALIEGEVRFDRHDRMLYATDASIYQIEPIGVVCPRNVEDVERVVSYSAEHGLPLLPRGGGTSLAGQTVNRAIVLDFSPYCREILEIDAYRRRARVQPGIVLDHLNSALASHGLMFGPDVASSAIANIGGMIGNNSAGARSIVYGRTVEHLIGLNVLLADGTRLKLHEGAAASDPRVHDLTRRVANAVQARAEEIDARFPKVVRRVDGYNLDLILKQLRESTPGTFDRVNLAHLVCGSEGTLAITTEATLNLVPLPKCVGLSIIAFADVDSALRALVSVLDTRPSAVELVDDVVINMALANMEYRRYVELLPETPTGVPGAVLYVEHCAEDDAGLQRRITDLRTKFASHTIQVHTEPSAMARAWKLRKAGEPLLHGIPGARKPITFIEDLAVDPAKLADFVAEFRALVARHGTTAAYYAHASVGCLHIRPLVCPRDPADLTIMRSISEEATDLVVRYGGALSGEHGDGRVRSHLLERFYGKAICDGFREIKAIFDPQNRLNPGNIVAPEPDSMTAHLRVKPLDRVIDAPPIKTYFRYEEEHGFGESLDRCNGAGVCRRMRGGTMCPSYRATLDERHATRGRGNALRLAITGQFSADGRTPAWNDPETLKTLDLCLSCKACKGECPSNVDIAKLKAEYLAQSYAHSGRTPLKARVFGGIRRINRLGSALHPIANALAGFAPIKAITDRVLGLHPRRSPIRFEQSLFTWMKRHAAKSKGRNENRPAVILFPDCFTVFNEPKIGRAAVLTLEALGYRVVLPSIGCCGRSQISTGMLAGAQAVCRDTAIALSECIAREQAVAVVGCEPSCISAIKDDWLDLDLRLDQSILRNLDAQTFLVEQFIDARWDEHPTRPWISAPPDSGPIAVPVLLHAHCHQKALWGADTSANALKRFLGSRLRVLDSGCCGMAGSFGYARDHYDFSMSIGERSLFCPLRESPEAIVVVPGMSCRQQIYDGLGRSALHPIELIAQQLGIEVRC